MKETDKEILSTIVQNIGTDKFDIKHFIALQEAIDSLSSLPQYAYNYNSSHAGTALCDLGDMRADLISAIIEHIVHQTTLPVAQQMSYDQYGNYIKVLHVLGAMKFNLMDNPTFYSVINCLSAMDDGVKKSLESLRDSSAF